MIFMRVLSTVSTSVCMCVGVMANHFEFLLIHHGLKRGEIRERDQLPNCRVDHTTWTTRSPKLLTEMSQMTIYTQ